jgi:hypothetical protein
MNPAEALFLYLPIPYWAASLLLLYRHDLSRLFHSVRDDGSLRNWWAVLSYMGILDAGVGRPGSTWEILPYVVYLSLSAGVSLSWTLGEFPQHWYFLIAVQGISGIILTAATMQYLGTPPRRPYADVLRYPRLGSRIRQLPEVSSPEQGVDQRPDTQAAKEAPTGNPENQERAE